MYNIKISKIMRQNISELIGTNILKLNLNKTLQEETDLDFTNLTVYILRVLTSNKH